MKASAALAAAVLPAASALAIADTDNFEFFFDRFTSITTAGQSANNVGGYWYDGSDPNNPVFWVASNTGAGQGIRKITRVNGTWTGDLYVGATGWNQFIASKSLNDPSDAYDISSEVSALSVPGGFVLNPVPLTINNHTYAANSLAIVVDASSLRLRAGNTVIVDDTKLFYGYDLQKVNTTPPAGGIDRNSDGNVDWNDQFEYLLKLPELQAAAGQPSTSTTANISRGIRFNSAGTEVYFVDTQTQFGGIWALDLTQVGTPNALRKVVDSHGSGTRISSEVGVLPTSARDLDGPGGPAGDQVLFQGSSDTGNLGGLSYVVDSGTAVSAPKTILSSRQIQNFLEIPGSQDITSIVADSQGNIFFSMTGVGLFQLDTAGRLAKLSDEAQRRLFITNHGVSYNSLIQQLQLTSTVVNGVPVTEVLYKDAGVRAPAGILAYTPGDFNRNGLVGQADVAASAAGQDDISLFKSKLALRGVLVANQTTNTGDLKYDLNAGATVNSVTSVAIDWKDVKIFQQFAGLSDGDVNMDYAVDATDLNTIAASYNGANNKLFTDGNLTSVRIDASDKDTVNYADLVTLAANWTGAKPALGAVGSIPQADLDAAFAITANGGISQYVAAAGGVWSAAANWSGAGVPDAPGAVASLLTKPQDDATLVVDGSYTLGQLNIDNAFTYTLSGPGTLHFQGGNGTGAQINIFANSPTIAAGVALDSPTTVAVAYAVDTATLSGPLSGSGSLTKTGSGTLLLTGANSNSGAITVAGGLLQAAKPASLPGYTVPGRIAVTSGGTLGFNVGGTSEWTAAQIDTARANATFGAGSAIAFDTSNNPSGFTYASAIGGLGGVTKLGANTLTLSGANTYAGATAVNAGTLQATATGALPGYNVSGKVSVAGGATLAVNAGGSGEWTQSDIAALRANGTFAAGSFLGIDTSNASGGAFTYAGVLGGVSVGLKKTGEGVLTLNRANTYTGPTVVAGGTLKLDFSDAGAPATNVIAATGTLQISGGTLAVSGKGSTTNSQTFASTTLSPGASAIALTASTSNPLLLALGSITRNPGGTLELTLPADAQNATNGITTSSTPTGYTTVGKTDFTAKSASNIIALASYADDSWTSLSTNTNVTMPHTVPAGVTTGTVRFNTPSSSIVTLSGAATIYYGGILVTPNVGANPQTITGGTLIGKASSDLIVHQHNTAAPLTIASAIADNTAATGLTKVGDGQLILSGALAYTGPTWVYGGTVTLQSNLTASPSLIIGGGTLELTAGGGRAINTTSLALTGDGAIDLNDNVMVVNYASASPAEQVRQYLLSGRAGGAWTGPGIRSTSAGADAQLREAIGYAEASDLLGLAPADTGTWNGQSVDGSSLLLQTTWYGDANLNGVIDADDFSLLDRGFAMGLAGWTNGDFNYSGNIDAADYLLIDRTFALTNGGTLSPALLAEREAMFGSDYVAELTASVPEPTLFSVLTVCCAATLGRRRRR